MLISFGRSLAAALIASSMLIVVGRTSQATDYCYMRTAEGQYISLNDLCGVSGPSDSTARIEAPRQTTPETAPEATEATPTTTTTIIRRSVGEPGSPDSEASNPPQPDNEPETEAAPTQAAPTDSPSSEAEATPNETAEETPDNVFTPTERFDTSPDPDVIDAR